MGYIVNKDILPFCQSTKNLILHCHSNVENISKFKEPNTTSLKTFKALYQVTPASITTEIFCNAACICSIF